MNLYSLLEKGFPKDKQACALETHDGLYYSWSDLERATSKIANFLKSLKLPAGSRIAVQVEKSPEALFLYLATIKAGYVYLPLNTAYQAAEIQYFLENAEPAVVACSSKNFSWVSKVAFKAGTKHVFTLDEDRKGTLLDRAGSQSDQFKTVAVKEDDLAAILYTSGTTGRSKGAMLTHKNLGSNAQVLQQFWGWQKNDVLLHALPIFHVHGLFVAAHGALINGSKMIWLPRLDTAQLIHHMPHSTVMMGVPTFYVRLLADKQFNKTVARNMRLFVSGSAPLLTETFNSFKEVIGQPILERYGMSETVMLVSNPYKGSRVGGSVGLPLPSVKVRVVNENNKPCTVNAIGSIQVKGPNIFKGYWRMPEKTAEEFTADGWFKTGDVGRWGGAANGGNAPDDYLCIVGRSKDLIISGGYNVYPKEIESFIDDMDGVDESAVIGIPHPDFGEAVMAVVVPKAGVTLDPQAMIATLKTQIANFKIPKRLEIVSDLPRNAMGKVQKNILRQQYTA
ncbi:malonate--CoA ligase [Polynucleobacter antarcticus]|uniref:Malonyl-CoA synthase n=1 Tax=Polynucleobacter antarcticus TaxID=1743162 RepID=A0A6M9PNE5_9BURK|nr:malonyl-CoA synthase [Polynucleobacter antarcticus]QKM62099.1 malonyl-CoA synthase [Polynucleobacter antarcticus]